MNLTAHKRIWLIAALTALTASANGSTFVFVPQLDSISGTTNYSWFSPANWFNPDGSGAGKGPGPRKITQSSPLWWTREQEMAFAY